MRSSSLFIYAGSPLSYKAISKRKERPDAAETELLTGNSTDRSPYALIMVCHSPVVRRARIRDCYPAQALPRALDRSPDSRTAETDNDPAVYVSVDQYHTALQAKEHDCDRSM
jgi:hypothetical protein